MTLRTGTELITLTILINKVTGVYGILALFTGYHLSGLQLSMYIYSIGALILTAILAPHIRKQTPLQCIALAWFYALDSIVNALYTAAFAFSWFLVLARHTAPLDGAEKKLTAPGSDMIDDTAGFTNPQYNVSHVDVVGADGLVGHASSDGTAAAANSGGGVIGSTILQSGSIASVAVISALWAIRLYFILVMMSYARGVLRQNIVSSSAAQGVPATAAKSEDAGHASAEATPPTPYLENPFAEKSGWAGKLGRAMIGFPKSYWLGPDTEGDARWMREVGTRFGRKESTGVHERERRRRAGTGPPLLKPIELDNIRT